MSKEFDNDEVIQITKEHEEYQKMISSVAAGNDIEVEQKMQSNLAVARRVSGLDGEHMEKFERGLRQEVEVRRKRRDEEQRQRRQEEQSQETRAESTDEPEVTGRIAEVRRGRGSAGLIRGGRTRPASKAKLKGMEEKENTEAKEKMEGKVRSRKS